MGDTPQHSGQQEQPASTDLVPVADQRPDAIGEAVAHIAAREATIEEHLAHLRAEVMADSAEAIAAQEDPWFDTQGKATDELKEESFAKFDTLEDTSSFDITKYRIYVKPVLTGLAVFVALMLAIFYFGVFGVGMARVPDLIGLTSAQATDQLRQEGLSVGKIVEEENPNIAIGVVLDQDPKVDRLVARGSTVALVVSSQSKVVSVPSVSDMSVDEATVALSQTRLTIEVVPTYDVVVAEGSIVGQLPMSDTLVQAGSTIYVLVSQGSAAIPLPTPRVMGLSAADAERVLRAAGFTPLPCHAATTFGKTGEVVAQTPATGVLTYPGSPVQYLISENLTGADSMVPDTVGMRIENARLLIEEAGFKVAIHPYVDSETTTGTVVAQMPLAQGTLARKGDTIDLLVVRGNDVRALVPNVLDLSPALASETLREQGFTPITVALPGAAKEGKIYQQFPARDSEYYIGLPVLLYAGEPIK